MLSLFSKKTIVIIDTNFLLLPGSQGIDIFTEITKLLNEPHQLCIVQATLFELKQIIENKGKSKDGFNAKLGLIMTTEKGIKTLKNSLGEGYADKEILSQLKENTIVATLDKKLQDQVQAKGGRIITFGRAKKLVLKQ